MTTIEATCPACGTVECSPEDFSLHVCSYAPSSYYVFTCPLCDQAVRKMASDRATELLIAEGVRAQHWELPAELMETHDGPPLTMDDVLDFHLLMERADWFAAIVNVHT